MINILGIDIPKQIIYVLLIIVIGLFVYRVLKKIVERIFRIYVKKAKMDIRKQHIMQNLIKSVLRYAILIIVVLSILSAFNVNTAAIVTSIGVVGLVIGLAFQDLFKDVLAGLFVILENQYAVGDIIEISGFKGEVVSFNLKGTKIKAPTGEVKIVANRNIMEVTNYSLNNININFDIKIAYDNDINKVDKAVEELVDTISKKLDSTVINLGIQNIDDIIIYRISVSVGTNKPSEAEQYVLKEIKGMLDKNNIKRK